jgi:hypothetical protein
LAIAPVLESGPSTTSTRIAYGREKGAIMSGEKKSPLKNALAV